MNSLAAKRRHPGAVLVVLFMGLCLTGVIYSVVGSAATAGAAPKAASSTEVDHGRQLFIEGCSSCHGIGAQGTQNAPTLVGVGAAAVDFQVSTGRMPLAAPGGQAERKPPLYTDEQISNLAAFIATLGPGPEIPSASDLNFINADLAEGGDLFRTNCAQCHNFAGSGGALSNGQYAPNLRQATPRQIYEAMLTGPQAMPVFANTTITPQDKQKILKYVTYLQTSPNPGGQDLGRLGPVTESLALFTIGFGALIAVSIWIGARAK